MTGGFGFFFGGVVVFACASHIVAPSTLSPFGFGASAPIANTSAGPIIIATTDAEILRMKPPPICDEMVFRLLLRKHVNDSSADDGVEPKLRVVPHRNPAIGNDFDHWAEHRHELVGPHGWARVRHIRVGTRHVVAAAQRYSRPGKLAAVAPYLLRS